MAVLCMGSLEADSTLWLRSYTQMVDACCSRTWKIRVHLMQAEQPEAYREDFGCTVGGA
jgi:hypothetical protein